MYLKLDLTLEQEFQISLMQTEINKLSRKELEEATISLAKQLFAYKNMGVDLLKKQLEMGKSVEYDRD